MANPGALPPSVYQGLGWGASADPTGVPDWGGLPPSVPQGMGWAPAPDAPPPSLEQAPQLPPTPTALPSMQTPAPQPAAPPGAPDFQVPVSAFGPGAAAAPPAPAPPRPGARQSPTPPRTFGEQMTNLQGREQGTEQAQQNAIQAGVEAQKPLHADQLAAFNTADATVKANAEARKAEDDAYQKIFATNTAKTAADRAAVDNWQFNQNKYMDDLGVGGTVRWGIAQILANVGQALMRNNGPNPVTEMLQQKIHDANEAQYKQRDALVQRLGFDRETGKDAAEYHATRQAQIDKADGLAYTSLAKQLEHAAVKSADPMAQAAGMKASADARQAGDERLKSFVAMQSQHDQAQQQIGIAGGHLALDRKKFDWEKDKDQQKLDLEAAALLAKRQGKLGDEESKRAIYIPDANGELVVARKKNGDPVLAGSADIAAKDQNMIASAASYNRLVGQMVRAIQANGGESTWIKGGEWQKMMTDLQSATAELHDAYGITAFREPTVQFFEKMATAGVDPTSFVRDASSALVHSNQNLQAKVNERVSARGYNGPQFGWQDTTKAPAPTDSQEDKLYKVATGSRGDDPGAIYNPKTGTNDPKVPGYYTIDPDASPIVPPASAEVQRISRDYPRMGPGQKAAIDVFAGMARGPDPVMRKRGLDHLVELARPGGTADEDGVRGYAQELLNRTVLPEEQNAPGAVTIDTPPSSPVSIPPVLRLRR